MEKTYFIYRYVRHDKNVPFYIGMGTRQDLSHVGSNNYSSRSLYYRAFSKDRNRTCLGIMDKTSYDVEIIYETTDLKHAEEKEKEFISMYGFVYDNTGTLTNLTKGGVSFKTTDEYVKNHHFACKRKGAKFSGKPKKMYMYDRDGSFIEEFESINGFYKKYNYGAKSIGYLGDAIKNNISYKGYYFSLQKYDVLDISKYKWMGVYKSPILKYKGNAIICAYESKQEAANDMKHTPKVINRVIESGKELDGFLFKSVKIHELHKMLQ